MAPYLGRPAQRHVDNAARGRVDSTGRGRAAPPRHRHPPRDNIYGITKPAIRRLARRGGVKRISADVYDQMRVSVKQRLHKILEVVALVVENAKRKTVTTYDVVWALNRLGTPVYGFGEPQLDAQMIQKRR